jgi:hypothetical protein
MREFKDLIDYDAIWIDMNEPSNFANDILNTECSSKFLRIECNISNNILLNAFYIYSR